MVEEPFAGLLARPGGKPRSRGLTCIRGPYYAPVGAHYLEDLLTALGEHVDALQYAGGSFMLMAAAAVRQLHDSAHAQDVTVSTGGFLERVLSWGEAYIDGYLRACRQLEFDVIEVSSVQLAALRTGAWGSAQAWESWHVA